MTLVGQLTEALRPLAAEADRIERCAYYQGCKPEQIRGRRITYADASKARSIIKSLDEARS